MRRYFLLVLFSLFSLKAKAEFDQNYETYFSGQTNSYDSSVLNPGNQVFQSPSDLAEADFRPNWQYSLMKSHKIVLRPRYLLTASTIRLPIQTMK